MLLTATAPPEVQSQLQSTVRNAYISKGNIDRQNIYFQCEEVESGDSKDFADFATRVSQLIGNECAIIYTDFIRHVGPIMSKLEEHGIDSVAYYGEMDPKSRTESYMRWKSGDVNVMVATTAFGMGINKPIIYVTLSDMEYPRVSAVGLRSLDVEVGMVLVQQQQYCTQWPTLTMQWLGFGNT